MIDTAAKRRNVAALMPLFAAGVTPDATPGVEWRQQAGWGYAGIAAGEAPAPSVSSSNGTFMLMGVGTALLFACLGGAR